MAFKTAYHTPRILLTLVGLITAIVPFIADFNETHVYNHRWPGHAKFHNGQTMSMGFYLGCCTLWKTWYSVDDDHLWTATVIAAAYYITQGSAYYYPGATAWDPPQHFSVPYVHLFVVVPMVSLVALAYGIEKRRVAGLKGSKVKAR